MSITLAEAKTQLNIDVNAVDDDAELTLYVAAANEWIATRVADTSPSPVKLAALFLVDHWWTSQRGPVGTPISEESVFVEGRGFAIPNRVLEILGPYITARATPSYSFPDAVAYPDPVEWPV